MIGNQMSLEHLSILHETVKIGTLGVPQLRPVQEIPIIHKCFPINVIFSKKIKDVWGHCFIDDLHQSCFWNNPFAHIDRLKELKGIVATDYSLFRDYPIAEQKWNCFKNRVMAYHWQQQGLNVIPTASWSIPDSFEWCWDGLPKNSVLGITTNGIATAKEGYRLFVLGLNELVKRLEPIALIVCGTFFTWMSEKYPNIKMIQIKSFGQLWNERKKLC